MRVLIQVSARPVCGAAQPEITALKAVSTVTVKASERTVRASREAMRKPSSGITPRFSGSTQNSVGSSALSAIGKMPQAYARSSTCGVISDDAESRDVMEERIAGGRKNTNGAPCSTVILRCEPLRRASKDGCDKGAR